MSTQTLLMRRTVLQTTAAATTLAAPFVRGAHAAGKIDDPDAEVAVGLHPNSP